MQFRNLTPFGALAYSAVDARDREYHVVALCAGYRLTPSHPDAVPADPRAGLFAAELIESPPLPLHLTDEYWGDPVSSSLRHESDLAPYKPKCDVLVEGQAYASQACLAFEAALALHQGGKPLLEKRLLLTGPRELVRQGGLSGWLLKKTNPTAAYTLDPPQTCVEVPLRYELAYGGACIVPAPKQADTGEETYLINEVCYRNPVGAGWVEARYFDALAQTPEGLPARLRAPQISPPGQPFTGLVQTTQQGSLDVRQMASINYQIPVAGFGPLGKAWAPRLAKAGTYDQAWIDTRHPSLPGDFDFAYWNGAPDDQQIPFPDLTQGLTLSTKGLRPGGLPMQVRMPPHRALLLANLGGAHLPLPMQIDTLTLDTSAQLIRLVWRGALLKHTRPDSLEVRFETDPRAPWVKYAALQGAQP